VLLPLCDTSLKGELQRDHPRLSLGVVERLKTEFGDPFRFAFNACP